MSGARFASMIQSHFGIFLAIAGSIYHSWKLGLVASTFVPFVLVGSMIQMKVISSQDFLETIGLRRSSKVKTSTKSMHVK